MIFEAGKNDIQFIVDILNEAYRRGDGWTTESELVSGDRASFHTIVSELNSGYKYYLYKEDDEYVACFNIFITSDTAEIGALAVKPRFQESGLGKYLLNQAELIASDIPGVNTLAVSVLEPRKELIGFYIRRGYTKTHLSYPFPIQRAVGVPRVNNLTVVVLQKNV